MNTHLFHFLKIFLDVTRFNTIPQRRLFMVKSGGRLGMCLDMNVNEVEWCNQYLLDLFHCQHRKVSIIHVICIGIQRIIQLFKAS